MNWEAAGAIGEILGAIAVVVTPIYLSKQLRENTTSNRVASSWNMMGSFNSMHETTVSNRNFAQVLNKAFSGEDLDDTERFQVNSLVLHHLNVLVAALEAHRSGQLSEELWDWTKQDAEWTLRPGFRTYLLSHLKLLPEDIVRELYGDDILNEVVASRGRFDSPDDA